MVFAQNVSGRVASASSQIVIIAGRRRANRIEEEIPSRSQPMRGGLPMRVDRILRQVAPERPGKCPAP